MSANDGKIRVTYQDIHLLIAKTAEQIKKDFFPELMIAIGGGGFFPARVLRTFLKVQGRKNIPIQAIGLSLYEELGTANPDPDDASFQATAPEKIGKEVVRTQWLDFSTLGSRPLVGRKILIVDEVDDSRTTLGYAVTELRKDIELQATALAKGDETKKKELMDATQLAIFVVHNKLKEKAATIAPSIKYFTGEEVLGDAWIEYPWEQQDILAHDLLAKQQKESRKSKLD